MASPLSIGSGDVHRSHESRISSILSSLSPNPLQTRAVHFQPLVGSLAVAFKEDIEPRVEIGAVVHMPHMRDLMGDDRAAHRRRRHDQPPAERNGSPAGTAAPPAAGIAKR